jgi:succinate dehydrogenase / fumarate reductase membrane anchor subunit
VNRMTHPLATARGHGSARTGLHHWLGQRVTALLLVFLVPWLLYALVCNVGASHAEVTSFVARPWNATLLILSLLVLLYHGMLGLQMVIEDYVHRRALELALHFSVRAATMLGAVFGVILVMQLAVGH